MGTIKAIVRNGQIEVEEPVDLPDGTELAIPIPASLVVPEEEWSNTPEAIEAWIRWYDALEPLEFTPAERAARDAAFEDDKQFELSHWEKRSQNIEKYFP
jgi:hypothetical protein